MSDSIEPVYSNQCSNPLLYSYHTNSIHLLPSPQHHVRCSATVDSPFSVLCFSQTENDLIPCQRTKLVFHIEVPPSAGENISVTNASAPVYVQRRCCCTINPAIWEGKTPQSLLWCKSLMMVVYRWMRYGRYVRNCLEKWQYIYSASQNNLLTSVTSCVVTTLIGSQRTCHVSMFYTTHCD